MPGLPAMDRHTIPKYIEAVARVILGEVVRMRQVVILALLVLVFINAFLLVISIGEESFDPVPPLEKDEYYRILNTELIPREKVTTFCVTDSVIVLFYDAQGLVNVYSLDGSFLYGLQVLTLRNGIGDIAVAGDYLYIKPRGNRMYVFEEKELIRNFRYSEDPTEYRRIEEILAGNENHSINEESYHYLPDTNQIVKRAPEGAMISVVTMPKINSDAQMLGIFLLMLIAALVHYCRFSNNDSN